MAVGIKVGSIIDEIGSGDFLHAFFSTVSGNLEDQWGTRFPKLLNSLYRGNLTPQDTVTALEELAEIRLAFSRLAPGQVIWDIEDRSKNPPWGAAIAPDITHLSNYFVTSTGRDLISVLHEALEAARDETLPAQVVRY